jgi:hypothetical protein
MLIYKVVVIDRRIHIVVTYTTPGTVAERSKACTVFDRSEAGILGSNPT